MGSRGLFSSASRSRARRTDRLEKTPPPSRAPRHRGARGGARQRTTVYYYY